VYKKNGVKSGFVLKNKTAAEDQREVFFDIDWYDIIPPTPEELEEALALGKGGLSKKAA
jgi:hypothetical protein